MYLILLYTNFLIRLLNLFFSFPAASLHPNSHFSLLVNVSVLTIRLRTLTTKFASFLSLFFSVLRFNFMALCVGHFVHCASAK